MWCYTVKNINHFDKGYMVNINKKYVLRKINQKYNFKYQENTHYSPFNYNQKATQDIVHQGWNVVFTSSLAKYTLQYKIMTKNEQITASDLLINIVLSPQYVMSLLKDKVNDSKILNYLAKNTNTVINIINVSLMNKDSTLVLHQVFKRIAQIEQLLTEKSELLVNAWHQCIYSQITAQNKRYQYVKPHPLCFKQKELSGDFISAFTHYYTEVLKPYTSKWGHYWKRQTLPVEGVNLNSIIEKAKQTGKSYKKGKLQNNYWLRKGNKIEYEHELIADHKSTTTYKKVAIKHDNRKLRQDSKKIEQQFIKNQKHDEPLPYKPDKWWD